MNVNDPLYRERAFAVVRRIPAGRVMTYGQLAIVLGEDHTARTVGYVMHASDDDVPWQRVINSQGKCSTGKLTIPINLQQELLEAEGVIFNGRRRRGEEAVRALELCGDGRRRPGDTAPIATRPLSREAAAIMKV